MSGTPPPPPQELGAAHKRRRMIDAMAELCAEQGYEATKVADVVRRAHVARKTLYDNFAGKEELFLMALDLTLAEADAQVTDACGAIPDEDWEARAEAGLRALLDFIAAHPAAARLWLVEAPTVGAKSAARYAATLDRLVARLRDAAPPRPGGPATLAEALVGGTVWIVRHQVCRGAATEVGALLPDLTRFVISPYRDVGKR